MNDTRLRTLSISTLYPPWVSGPLVSGWDLDGSLWTSPSLLDVIDPTHSTSSSLKDNSVHPLPLRGPGCQSGESGPKVLRPETWGWRRKYTTSLRRTSVYPNVLGKGWRYPFVLTCSPVDISTVLEKRGRNFLSFQCHVGVVRIPVGFQFSTYSVVERSSWSHYKC